jgi:hypothetical protein
MKKLIIGVLTAIIVLLGGATYLGGTGDSQKTNYQVMAGEVSTTGVPSTLCLMPVTYVDSNSTSTNAANNGCEINQMLDISGVEKINIVETGKGGTATSTLFTKLMGSYDGINWFGISGNSTTTESVSTSTLYLSDKVLAYDFGTGTTTKTYEINIPPVKYLRTLFYGEDVATDPADFVKANITIGWINK